MQLCEIGLWVFGRLLKNGKPQMNTEVVFIIRDSLVLLARECATYLSVGL